ncbi:RNA directed DNA polymerase reverse transcriptase [Echinococcus multilocularis]|uniref:RNA directed DNA polymerase reverse transcriptase n=1 Tax=Echinococcus multilocularis TaxID=6211 RepID=A0A068XYR3_ECHMU|nr:RNA directed DNA polymerase reverse transcriptase [Echinococcus multilocularis]
MPFGLCNAAAAFQRLMQTALIGQFPKHCILYLDDILVFGGDIQEHNANLKRVLDRLWDAGLTLNPKKCRFLQRSVTFLGHTVSSNGIAVTDDCVQQVRTWPTPTNQTELRSFLGLANYYRRFVKSFAKIDSPLHKLTEKRAKKNFKWEKEYDEAFKELKRMLCSTPILALPNFESRAPPFILYTDVGDVAVGGVLSQKDIKGREHVIAYASTRHSKKRDRKERRNAPTWLKTMKEIDCSVALWYEELQQYDFTVQYRKGKGHGNADALSRRPTPAETDDVTVHTVFLSDPTRHHWRNTQSTDLDTAVIYEKFLVSSHKPASEEITSASKAARRIWQEWSKLSLEDEILRGKSRYRHYGSSSTHQERKPIYLDYFAKAAEAEPMKSQDAETIASVFFNRWICQNGVPESVHSDQGPNFESRLFIELSYRATVHTSTDVSPFKMLTGREMRVPSDIFVPNTDGSADNVPEQKKCYDRHCRTNVYREGDLVQIYRPVPPPGTHRKFHHLWSRDPFRVVKALSPTNYLVRNAHLRTQPITVHHNKMRPYKGPPPVGYEDEVYVLTEDRRPPVRNLNGSSEEAIRKFEPCNWIVLSLT